MFSGEFEMDDAEPDCCERIEPICPYCKRRNPINWDTESPNLNDGGEWERECLCGEKYPVRTTVTEYFTTVKYDPEREV